MSVKEKAVVALTVTGLFTGAMWYFEPHTSADVREQHIQQQESDLSDSQQNLTDQQRREGMEAGEANRRQQLGTSERRPSVKLPRIWRW